jgi:hypothetical protein
VTLVGLTSQVRHSGTWDYSGFFRVVDLDSGRTLLTQSVPDSPWRRIDPNPRGGLRGAKGLSGIDDRLIVTNTDTLFVLDSSWSKVGEISSPHTGSVHDVLAEEDSIWITCTHADLLLKVDWQGNRLDSWSWRSDPELVAALGLPRVRPFDPGVDYRDPLQLQGGVYNIAQLSSVTRCSEGLLLTFGRVLTPRELRLRRLRARIGRVTARFGIQKPAPEPPWRPRSLSAIVLLRQVGGALAGAKAELLLKIEDTYAPNHNALEVGDLIVYGDSNGNRLVGVDRTTGTEEIVVDVPGDPPFVRGLTRLEDGTILVGSQKPLAFYAVDLGAGQIVAEYPLDGQPAESAHALAVLPPSFPDPTGREDIFAGGAREVA